MKFIILYDYYKNDYLHDTYEFIEADSLEDAFHKWFEGNRADTMVTIAPAPKFISMTKLHNDLVQELETLELKQQQEALEIKERREFERLREKFENK